MDRTRPLRVLHVVGQMNPGGVEVWLLNVFRNADPDAVAFDVMVHNQAEGAYDREIRSLGIGIHCNPEFRNPYRYYRRLAEIVGRPNRYDVIHGHVHHYSGLVLALAAALGVPARIAHSHNDTSVQDRSGDVPRRAYLALMKALLRRSATLGLACSELAGASLFGATWQSDSRWRLLYYGIDPAMYRIPSDASGVRAEFDLPPDAELLIHVGRFDHQKNHAFLAKVFEQITVARPSAYLMLVGTGPLQAAVREWFGGRGLGHRVRFCGRRSDVPRLLTASNLFVFPSHHEGLPVACLEAQAAGLPLLLSDRISREVIAAPARATVLPLGDTAVWARAADAALATEPDRAAGVSAIAGSRFDITRSTSSLLETYAALRGESFGISALRQREQLS